MGRPTKLTDDRLVAIRTAVRRGLSDREAAAACGVHERTWATWKARAREIRDLDAPQLERMRVGELRELAQRVGVELSQVVGTGARGTVVKADLVRAALEQVEPYRQFLQEIEDAEPWRKAALLDQLARLADGGALIVEVDDRGRVRRRGVRVRRTVTHFKLVKSKAKDGTEVDAWVPHGMVEVVDERELPPNRMAVQRMLEIGWPDEFGRRRAIDPGEQATEEERARRIVESARAMWGTVPQLPEVAGGDGGGEPDGSEG